MPAAVLSEGFAGSAPDPLEPSVLCDIEIDGERISSVVASSGPGPGGVDVGGSLTFPGLVDAHVHLDKTHTWGRAPNRSGTFDEALETLARDKENWTREDLLKRAGFGLHCAWEHGTRLIRTHVDTWLPFGEVNHAAMHELRQAWKGRIELQTVPLTGLANYSGGEGEQVADLAASYGASALGGFSRMVPGIGALLDRLLSLAKARGLGVDLHVDENGIPGEEVLREVALAVLRNQFPHPVVCGHCCSLAVQDEARQRSTIALVREAGVRIVSLPLCNAYLQDRRGSQFPRTPRWRGLTLIHDLMDAGVPLAVASDNVRDAFHAYGDYDMAEVYLQSVRWAHLDERLGESARLVTSAAASLLGRPELGRVAPGSPAHLVVFPATSFSEFLSRPGSRRRLVDGESIRDARPPNYEELL